MSAENVLPRFNPGRVSGPFHFVPLAGVLNDPAGQATGPAAGFALFLKLCYATAA